MNWINKLKQILVGFLSTHDGKYLITDKGLKLVAFDKSYIDEIKSITSFGNSSKSNTNYSNKTKS